MSKREIPATAEAALALLRADFARAISAGVFPPGSTIQIDERRGAITAALFRPDGRDLVTQ